MAPLFTIFFSFSDSNNWFRKPSLVLVSFMGFCTVPGGNCCCWGCVRILTGWTFDELVADFVVVGVALLLLLVLLEDVGVCWREMGKREEKGRCWCGMANRWLVCRKNRLVVALNADLIIFLYLFALFCFCCNFWSVELHYSEVRRIVSRNHAWLLRCIWALSCTSLSCWCLSHRQRSLWSPSRRIKQHKTLSTTSLD